MRTGPETGRKAGKTLTNTVCGMSINENVKADTIPHQYVPRDTEPGLLVRVFGASHGDPADMPLAVSPAPEDKNPALPARDIEPDGVEPFPVAADPLQPQDDDVNEELDTAVRKVHRDEETAIRRRHDLSRKAGDGDQSDTTLAGGDRDPLVAVSETGSAAARRKKEEQNRTNMAILERDLREINARIAEIDRQIEALNERATQLREEIDDLQDKMVKTEAELEAKYGADWEDKLKNGELDKNDPLLQDYLLQQQQLGQKSQELRETEQKIEDLKQEREDIANKQENLRAQKNELEKTQTPEAKEKLQQLREESIKLKIQAQSAEREQVDLEGTEGITNRVERDKNIEAVAEIIGPDDEIESFMKDFAKAQKIDDKMERLAAEKELATGLSSEAREMLSYEPDTEKLFEESYFAALDNPTRTGTSINQVAQPTGSTPDTMSGV